MTIAEIFDMLPQTERALRVKRDDFPFTVTNDWQVDAPHHWRVTSTDGKTLGLVFYRAGRKSTYWDRAAHPVTIRFDNPTAPIIGVTNAMRVSDAGHFLCHDCGQSGDAPVHGDDDPDCLPPVCHKCGAVLAIPNEELSRAFADWNAGYVFVDGKGTYFLRRDSQSPCYIADWNKVIKRAYPDPAVFEAAAKINAEGGQS